MVVISEPSARAAGTRHDITATPSRKTVQAPHSPSAHPSLLPVRPRARNQSSRVAWEPDAGETDRPLTVVGPRPTLRRPRVTGIGGKDLAGSLRARASSARAVIVSSWAVR